MSDTVNHLGLMFGIYLLPVEVQDIMTKLYQYGYDLMYDDGAWILRYPQDSCWGGGQKHFDEDELHDGLLQALRYEEEQRGVLVRYEQFSGPWANKVYGNAANDTKMKNAGCGPTALAIVLQYLMNNGSSQRTGIKPITPLETMKYAAKHGRVSATDTSPSRGTSVKKMIKDIHSKWSEYDGMEVEIDQAMELVEKGWLIIFTFPKIQGLKKNLKPAKPYGGHIMVLAGVQGNRGPDRLFNVLDPGRNKNNATWFVTQKELAKRASGFWWVYPVSKAP